MDGRPSHLGKVVSRKPNMNIGSMPYWVSIACAQPGGTDGCGQPCQPKRIEASSSAHQAMLVSTASAPARNSGRCGAAASSAATGGNVWVEDGDSRMRGSRLEMRAILRRTRREGRDLNQSCVNRPRRRLTQVSIAWKR